MSTPVDFGVYDDHTKPHAHPTVIQLALALVWAGAAAYSLLFRILKQGGSQVSENANPPTIGDVGNNIKTTVANAGTKSNEAQVVVNLQNEVLDRTNGKTVSPIPQEAENKSQLDSGTKSLFSKVPPPPEFDQLMWHIVTYGLVMFYYYLCDYVKVCIYDLLHAKEYLQRNRFVIGTDFLKSGRSIISNNCFVFYLCFQIFPSAERSYVGDTFLFLVFIFFLVGCAFTIKPTSDKILNR